MTLTFSRKIIKPISYTGTCEPIYTNFINRRCSDLPVIEPNLKGTSSCVKKNNIPSHQQSRLHNTCRNCKRLQFASQQKKNCKGNARSLAKQNIIEPSNENQVYRGHNSSDIKIKPGSKVESIPMMILQIS